MQVVYTLAALTLVEGCLDDSQLNLLIIWESLQGLSIAKVYVDHAR
jgi:hypothetical protein